MLFIEKPPLVSFRIDFKFSKPEKISFEMMAQVESLLQKSFPNVPSLNIIEYPFDSQIQVEIPIQIGPVRFQNKDKSSQIQLFSNGLIFNYTKYSSWEKIKENIKDILFKTCKILGIKSIEHIRIEYIDEFSLPIEDFDLRSYFNLNINQPKDWSIDYRDFLTGIKISSEDPDKFIIRLRGLPPKESEHYLFRFEGLYLYKKNLIIGHKEDIITQLDLIHDLIEKHFIEIMSEKLKKEIGVRVT